MINPEQLEAINSVRTEENQAILYRDAQRKNTDSITENNLAIAKLVIAKAKIRATFRRCAVFACVLALGWSCFGWAVVR